MPSPLDEPESSIPPQTPELSGVVSPSDGAQQPLAIEYPSTSSVEAQEEEVHKLDLGEGNVVKLDRLGPIIVNSDGNWHELGEIERARTVRLLVKRNLVRMEKMDEQERAAGRAQGGEVSALKEGRQA